MTAACHAGYPTAKADSRILLDILFREGEFTFDNASFYSTQVSEALVWEIFNNKAKLWSPFSWMMEEILDLLPKISTLLSCQVLLAGLLQSEILNLI